MAKRGQNEGSIFQRQDGRWVAVLNLGYKPDGRRARKSVYGGSRKEVQLQLTALLRDQQRGLPVDVERQTVAQYLERWLEDVARPTVRPSTFTSYRLNVRRHLIPALGRHQLAALAPQHVQALMNEKLAEGLSPRTVQYIRAILRRALGQALKWGAVTRNVATLVDPPRERRSEIRPLSPEQARALLDAIRGDRLEALITVALALGLRQGEALGLRWSDVDLAQRTLFVRNTMQRIDGKPTFVEPKTRRSRRTLTLPTSTVAALEAHRLRQEEERLKAGGRWQEWDLVFPSVIGTPLDGSNVTHRLQRILAEAGLPRQRFHDLRHCCASLLLAQGVHPRAVMEVLGHSQIALTMNTYSHVMPAMMHDVADRMESILSNKP